MINSSQVIRSTCSQLSKVKKNITVAAAKMMTMNWAQHSFLHLWLSHGYWQEEQVSSLVLQETRMNIFWEFSFIVLWRTCFSDGWYCSPLTLTVYYVLDPAFIRNHIIHLSPHITVSCVSLLLVFYEVSTVFFCFFLIFYTNTDRIYIHETI